MLLKAIVCSLWLPSPLQGTRKLDYLSWGQAPGWQRDRQNVHVGNKVPQGHRLDSSWPNSPFLRSQRRAKN